MTNSPGLSSSMARALELARAVLGTTSPNPSVGAGRGARWPHRGGRGDPTARQPTRGSHGAARRRRGHARSHVVRDARTLLHARPHSTLHGCDPGSGNHAGDRGFRRSGSARRWPRHRPTTRSKRRGANRRRCCRSSPSLRALRASPSSPTSLRHSKVRGQPGWKDRGDQRPLALGQQRGDPRLGASPPSHIRRHPCRSGHRAAGRSGAHGAAERCRGGTATVARDPGQQRPHSAPSARPARSVARSYTDCDHRTIFRRLARDDRSLGRHRGGDGCRGRARGPATVA